MKQILHLVPSKNLFICFCYISLHLPKIGQNLISAGHWIIVVLAVLLLLPVVADPDSAVVPAFAVVVPAEPCLN